MNFVGPRVSKGFLAEIGVNKEDLDRVTEMERRRAQGEYILQNERPTTRKFLDHDFSGIVARTAANRAAEYESVFAQAGVGPEVAEQLKTHVAKIHRASLEAEVALQQVLNARRDYDERLRSTMTEADYRQYRQYEESKPAVREVEKLREFAGAKNMAIEPTHEQALLALLQEAQAFTSRSWHGPFDGLPEPIVGIENVVPFQEQQIRQLAERAHQLLGRAAETGLPENQRNLLASYYVEQVQKKQRGLEEFKAGFASGNPAGSNPARPDGARR